jgi:hypothetical protein
MTDSDQGSVWASIVAALAVTCALGALYSPIVIR